MTLGEQGFYSLQCNSLFRHYDYSGFQASPFVFIVNALHFTMGGIQEKLKIHLYFTTVRLYIFSQQYLTYQRLQWSRGSVPAFSTQVRGFKPGRSRRIFRAKKILSTPSFRGEVKPLVPCCRFAACKNP